MAIYVLIAGTKKATDDEAVMDGDEYEALSVAEVEERENDERFMRANAMGRALRYGGELKGRGNYWQWAEVGDGGKAREKEDEHMKTLAAQPGLTGVGKAGGGGGGGGGFGGPFGGKKKNFGTAFG